MNETCDKKCETKLSFKGDNPGAVQYGNFINYYQFHPPEERITLLPNEEWKDLDFGEDIVALDIGCNAGDLTIALYNHIKSTTNRNASILGIDIDPTLIQRATEKNPYPNNITFKTLDFTDENSRQTILNNHLANYTKQKFDAVFCFSTTMWIHLNHGDAGLERFLQVLCEISNLLVIEPQPWKCYRSALKRVNASSEEVFPFYKQLVYRSDIEVKIEEIILKAGKVKIRETERTQWGRKLLFFK